MNVGITGGIGCGKSTVARMVAECLQAEVLDADVLAHDVTARGGAAIPAIAREFGREFIAADGAMDRQRMREHVFSDPAQRQRLQDIIHPLLRQIMTARVMQARASGDLLVLDIPLLAETSAHWLPLLDKIIVVECSRATQIHRVVSRSAVEPAAVERIIDAQATPQQRRAIADAVIVNDGVTKEELRREVARVVGLLSASGTGKVI